MTFTPPKPRTEPDLPAVVVDKPIVVLPAEFEAYVEILRNSDPAAHILLSRELAAAEEGPAAVEVAAHRRRAQMLASLETALSCDGGTDA